MALKASLLLALFLLITATLARQQHHQQHHQQQQNQCDLRNIEALEPYNTLQAEAGVTEFWDSNDQQFQCAGVDFIRHRIQPGGLLLPSYVNAPHLAFVQRGEGVVLPGCQETFEYSSEQQFSERDERGEQGRHGGQRFQDHHQSVQNLRRGDVLAIDAGAVHWIYNDGNEELVIAVFFDTQNQNNQLDQRLRRFFLAGNPQAQQQGQGQGEGHGQRQPRRQHQGGSQEEQSNFGNIFDGLDVDFIAEAFNVKRETAEKLQGGKDNRGHIVNAKQDIHLILPSRAREEQEYDPRRRGGRGRGDSGRGGRGRGGSNGFEETICSLKLKENIDNPSHVDLANPQAGRHATLNSYKFPILRELQLSAERVGLRPNAIHSPRWTLNAHTLLYATDGSLRVQIVNHRGESVFDGELREGQVVVIPQNFAVIKRANEEGAAWIGFKTNDNAMVNHLAGRGSAIRSLPVDVVANAYQLSREEAHKLKFRQDEAVLLSPSSSRGQRLASA